MSRKANLFLSILCVLCFSAQGQVTYTGTLSQDAFLATGSAANPYGANLTNNNYGGAGTLAVSPASATKGEFQSLVMFNFADAVAFFNTTYGSNSWIITGISLTLTSNYGTAGKQPNNMIFNIISGGNFVIERLSNDDWEEGSGTPALPTMDGVTYGSLPDLLSGPTEILCTNTYSPPGNDVPVTYTLPLNANLISDIMNGDNTTLLFYAADNQIGYLFNSYTYGRGNEPMISVTAAPFFKILSGNFANGVFHLTGLGGPNLQYQVQTNSNLTTTNWATIGTVTAGTNGLIQFNDTTATNQQRFYRLSF